MKVHKNKRTLSKILQNFPDFDRGFWFNRYCDTNSLLGVFVLINFLFLPKVVMGQAIDPVFNPAISVEKLAGDFSFTEGPAVDREGNVYFTDQPNNRIWVWTIEGKLELFTDQSGRSNGMYFDPEGRLLACADMDNELWRFNPDKSHEILISNYNGHLLNGPNDLWVRPDGGVYFTDPLYKRNYWTRDPEMQQPGQYVYYFDPAKQHPPVRVEMDLVKPNGLIGHADKKMLYIADIGDSKIYSYKMKKNGKLKRKKLFTDMGADGMTIDERGNIYLAGKGVTIFNSNGRKIGHIPVPEPWTANVCFGGADGKTLFITASTGFYAMKMNVKGMKSF